MASSQTLSELDNENQAVSGAGYRNVRSNFSRGVRTSGSISQPLTKYDKLGPAELRQQESERRIMSLHERLSKLEEDYFDRTKRDLVGKGREALEDDVSRVGSDLVPRVNSSSLRQPAKKNTGNISAKDPEVPLVEGVHRLQNNVGIVPLARDKHTIPVASAPTKSVMDDTKELISCCANGQRLGQSNQSRVVALSSDPSTTNRVQKNTFRKYSDQLSEKLRGASSRKHGPTQGSIHGFGSAENTPTTVVSSLGAASPSDDSNRSEDLSPLELERVENLNSTHNVGIFLPENSNIIPGQEIKIPHREYDQLFLYVVYSECQPKMFSDPDAKKSSAAKIDPLHNDERLPQALQCPHKHTKAFSFTNLIETFARRFDQSRSLACADLDFESPFCFIYDICTERLCEMTQLNGPNVEKSRQWLQLMKFFPTLVGFPPGVQKFLRGVYNFLRKNEESVLYFVIDYGNTGNFDRNSKARMRTNATLVYKGSFQSYRPREREKESGYNSKITFGEIVGTQIANRYRRKGIATLVLQPVFNESKRIFRNLKSIMLVDHSFRYCPVERENIEEMLSSGQSSSRSNTRTSSYHRFDNDFLSLLKTTPKNHNNTKKTDKDANANIAGAGEKGALSQFQEKYTIPEDNVDDFLQQHFKIRVDVVKYLQTLKNGDLLSEIFFPESVLDQRRKPLLRSSFARQSLWSAGDDRFFDDVMTPCGSSCQDPYEIYKDRFFMCVNRGEQRVKNGIVVNQYGYIDLDPKSIYYIYEVR